MTNDELIHWIDDTLSRGMSEYDCRNALIQIKSILESRNEHHNSLTAFRSKLEGLCNLELRHYLLRDFDDAFPELNLAPSEEAEDFKDEQVVLYEFLSPGTRLSKTVAAREIERLTIDDFKDPRHRSIFRAIKHLNHCGAPFTVVAVQGYLISSNEAGIELGNGYLHELADLTNNRSNS